MDPNLMLPIVQLGHELIMESDDEETDKRSVEKVSNFAEETVPKFSSNQFKEHFRMRPAVFIDVITKLQESVKDVVLNKKGHPELDLDKQLMMTLWYLGNIESFR